jgi:hypothetical protein
MLIPLVTILALVAISIGTIVVLITWKKRQQGKPYNINYLAFFLMGVCFLGAGIVLMTTINSAFIGLIGIGVVSIIISLANRNKW